jgi:hypothetical protein
MLSVINIRNHTSILSKYIVRDLIVNSAERIKFPKRVTPFQAKSYFGSWAPVLLLFKKIENHTYLFQKNLKKNLNILNDVAYNPVKF